MRNHFIAGALALGASALPQGRQPKHTSSCTDAPKNGHEIAPRSSPLTIRALDSKSSPVPGTPTHCHQHHSTNKAHEKRNINTISTVIKIVTHADVSTVVLSPTSSTSTPTVTSTETHTVTTSDVSTMTVTPTPTQPISTSTVWQDTTVYTYDIILDGVVYHKTLPSSVVVTLNNGHTIWPSFSASGAPEVYSHNSTWVVLPPSLGIVTRWPKPTHNALSGEAENDFTVHDSGEVTFGEGSLD
ncbi:hypothetical protein FKW77_009165 [Venturia effusa]|uniref:Uncharacterized protein n=1 Tax=Venturia effusa TaxID=50376 RepID=A0A517L9X1_9PEZI|nr:hypothetical protein FKW77_009165 [Venturia effusa]